MASAETLLWAAAAASAATFLTHVFAGGAHVARPLLADRSLPRASKWLNYYCWHITSAAIALMTAVFAAAASGALGAAVAAYGAPRVCAACLAVFAAILSALSAAVAVKGGIHPLRFPSTSLFALIAVLAGAALAF